jgi:hypothetical protein
MNADNVGQRVPPVSDFGIIFARRIAPYREESFKPFVIAAMIYLARGKSPLTVLGKLIK